MATNLLIQLALVWRGKVISSESQMNNDLLVCKITCPHVDWEVHIDGIH